MAEDYPSQIPFLVKQLSRTRLNLTLCFTALIFIKVKTFEEHSRYPVLPPLTKSREATQEDIDMRVQQCVVSVHDRTLQVNVIDLIRLIMIHHI